MYVVFGSCTGEPIHRCVLSNKLDLNAPALLSDRYLHLYLPRSFIYPSENPWAAVPCVAGNSVVLNCGTGIALLQ